MSKSTFTYYEVGAYEKYENDEVLGQFKNKANAEEYYGVLMLQYSEFTAFLHTFPLKENDNSLDIFTKEGDFVWGDKYEHIPTRMQFHAIHVVEDLKRYGKADPDYCGYYCTERTIMFDD